MTSDTPTPQFVSSLKRALQITVKNKVRLDLPQIDDAPEGLTIQAWVRQARQTGGVSVFADANFGGTKLCAKPGLYRDLSRFPATRDGIGSLRMHQEWRLVLFDGLRGTGQAIAVTQNDTAFTGFDGAPPRSMLVLDPVDFAEDRAVLWHSDGTAHLVSAGRYTPPKGHTLTRAILPAGAEIVLYPNTDFTGEPVRCIDPDADLTDMPCRAAIIAKPHGARDRIRAQGPYVSNGAMPATMSLVTDDKGFGLELGVKAPDTPDRPVSLTLGNKKLREEVWHHISSTFDGTDRRDYLDGRLVATTREPKIPNIASQSWSIALNDSEGDLVWLDLDITAISIFRGARTQRALSAARHVLPDASMDDLIEGWPLTRSQKAGLAGVVGKRFNESSDVQWVAAKLPRSLGEAPTAELARNTLRKASAEKAAAHQAEATHKIASASARAAHLVAEATAKARAEAYMLGLQSIYGISVGSITRAKFVEGAFKQTSNEKAITDEAQRGTGNIIAYTRSKAAPKQDQSSTNQTPPQEYYVSLMETAGSDSGQRRYTIFAPIPDAYNPSRDTAKNSELYSTENPILGLIDDTSGYELHPALYWVEADGQVWRVGVKDGHTVTQPEAFARVPTRGAGALDLAINEASKQLFIANRHDIWRVSLGQDGAPADVSLIVGNATSPAPIAMAVDEGTGAIFWLDAELEGLFRAQPDGTSVVRLYDAPNPRPGLALDYVDMGGVANQAKDGQDTTHKRLYWTASGKWMVPGTLAIEPGPFLELTGHTHTSPARRILRDTVDALGTSTTGYVPNLEPFVAHPLKGYIDAFWYTADGHLRVLSCADDKDHRARRILYVLEDESSTDAPLPVVSVGDEHNQFYQAFAYKTHPASGRYAVRNGAGVEIHRSVQLSPDVDERAAPAVLDFSDTWQLRLGFDAQEMFQHLTFSSTGDYLFAKWDRENAYGYVLCSSVSGVPLRKIEDLGTFATGVRDGVEVIVCTYSDRFHSDSLFVYDLETQRHFSELRVPWVVNSHHITLNRDVTRAYVSNYKSIREVDLASGKVLREFSLDAATYDRPEAFLSADEARIMATWGSLGLLMVWDISTGQIVHRLFVGKGSYLRGLTYDEQHAIIECDQVYMRVPLSLRDHDTVLNFDYTARAQFHPLQVDFSDGFTAQLHLRIDQDYSQSSNDLVGMSRILQFGADDAENIALFHDFDHGLLVSVTDDRGIERKLDFPDAPVRKDKWVTIVITIDPHGWGTMSVGQQSVYVDGFVGVLRGGVYTSGYVSQDAETLDRRLNKTDEQGYYSYRYEKPLPYIGNLDVLRLHNRQLTDTEIDTFHAHPAAVPQDVLPKRERKLLDATRVDSMLMSGTDDGNAPAVTITPFETDNGLYVDSDGTENHSALIVADHNRIEAHVVAAKRRATAQAEREATLAKAHKETNEGLKEADRRVKDGHRHADDLMAPAKSELARAKAEKKRKVNAAQKEADTKVYDAQIDHDRKVDNAHDEKNRNVSAAQKRLHDAQNKRDASAFAKDGSTLKEHGKDD